MASLAWADVLREIELHPWLELAGHGLLELEADNEDGQQLARTLRDLEVSLLDGKIERFWYDALRRGVLESLRGDCWLELVVKERVSGLRLVGTLTRLTDEVPLPGLRVETFGPTDTSTYERLLVRYRFASRAEYQLWCQILQVALPGNSRLISKHSSIPTSKAMHKPSPPEAEFQLTPEDPGQKPPQGFWRALEDLMSDQPAPPAWRQDKPDFASLEVYLQQVLPEVFAYLDERPREADGAWRIGLSLDRAGDLERKVLPDLVSQLRSYAADGEDDALYSAVFTLLTFLVRDRLREGELPVYTPLHFSRRATHKAGSPTLQ